MSTRAVFSSIFFPLLKCDKELYCICFLYICYFMLYIINIFLLKWNHASFAARRVYKSFTYCGNIFFPVSKFFCVVPRFFFCCFLFYALVALRQAFFIQTRWKKISWKLSTRKNKIKFVRKAVVECPTFLGRIGGYMRAFGADTKNLILILALDATKQHQRYKCFAVHTHSLLRLCKKFDTATLLCHKHSSYMRWHYQSRFTILSTQIEMY